MVQAAQALTESTDRSNHVKATMIMFIERLTDCRGYCLNNGSRLFPFKRAITQLIDTAHICFPDDPTVKALELPEYTTIINPRRCKKPIEKVELGTLEVPRLFFGLWQLSSPAWGSASQEDIVEGMNEMVSKGLVAADMAGESKSQPRGLLY